MHAIEISNATRNLGKPIDWDDERDGPCGSLAIRDTRLNGAPCMLSAWQPSPEELAALNAGAKIYLHVIGGIHPPVAISVGE